MEKTLWLLQLLFNVVMLFGLLVLARGQGTRRSARGRGKVTPRRFLPRLRFSLPRRRSRAASPPRETPAEEPAEAAPGAPLEVPSVLADLVAEAERREELAAERALRERLAAFRAREAG